MSLMEPTVHSSICLLSPGQAYILLSRLQSADILLRAAP